MFNDINVFDLQYLDFIKVLSIGDNKTFNSLYCCDLMGYALGHIKNIAVLLTIVSSINTVAVAIKLNLPAIIFCEGEKPLTETIKYAKENGISLFISKLNTYETARLIDLKFNH